MKTKSILATILCATLLLAGCSKEENMDKGPAGTQRSMTFTLRTPAGDKVIYSKAVHDESEYKINRLALYEYEVADDGTTTTLSRILKYPDGLGDNTLDLVDGGNGTYTFSIIIPQSNDGKKFAYKFIANDQTADPDAGSSFDDFKTTEATVALTEGNTADALAADGTGIAMSGVAKNGSDETITMQEGITCTVQMTRIVSRVDIKYETPNLKVTKVELQNAPKKGYLFPQDALTAPATEDDALTLGLNANVTLPTGYLKDEPDQTVVELKKAFYLYERSNEDGNTAQVHIEYEVAANGTTYTGAVDVPFKKTSDDLSYVNAQRNHLYTIVLGHADDPVAGKVTAKLVVDEWNSVEIDEPMTEDPGPYSTAALGDIMLSDGTLVKAGAITEEQKQQAIGVVAFLYSADRQPKDGVKNALTDKGVDTPHGLVLALKNADTKATWGPETDAGHSYKDGEDGYTITSDLAQKSDYPAFAEVAKYEASVPTSGITCTGWYIPSLGEWIDIMGSTGIGNSSEVDVLKTTTEGGRFDGIAKAIASSLNSHLDKVGDSNVDKFFVTEDVTDEYYWSSSESADITAYMAAFRGNDMFFDTDGKNYSYLVRCVFAF